MSRWSDQKRTLKRGTGAAESCEGYPQSLKLAYHRPASREKPHRKIRPGWTRRGREANKIGTGRALSGFPCHGKIDPAVLDQRRDMAVAPLGRRGRHGLCGALDHL
jgi:hypothetical protein